MFWPRTVRLLATRAASRGDWPALAAESHAGYKMTRLLSAQQCAITSSRASLAYSLSMAVCAPVFLASGYLVISGLPDSPCWDAEYRLIPAGVLLLCVRPRLLTGLWWLRSMAAGTLNFGAYFACQALAIHRLTPGLAASLVATTTIMAPLFLAPLGVQVRGRQLLSGGISVVGLSVTSGWLSSSRSFHFDVLGICAALATAASLAGGKVLTTYWGQPPNVPSITATGWQLAGGGIVLLPATIITESTPPSLNLSQWGSTIWLVVAATAAAYAMQIGALHRGAPPTAVSQLALLCPLLAAMLDWIRSPSPPPLPQVVAAVAVLAAIVMGTVSAVTINHYRHASGRGRRS